MFKVVNKTFKNKIINGNTLAKKILSELKAEISLAQPPPKLSILLAGDNIASESYVKKKIQIAQQIGISYQFLKFTSSQQSKMIQSIHHLNKDPSVTGILAQLPFPNQYNKEQILSAISPSKDIDCLHPHNLSLLFQYGEEAPIVPCTPQAVLHVFDQSKIDISGKKVVMLGRSNLVGLPLSMLMMKRNATVTICHSHSQDHIDDIIEQSDIVVSATGVINLVNKTKPGAIIIDIGISRIPGTKKIVGDVNRETVKDFDTITPVPGGIGPLTVTMLMKNVVRLWKQNLSKI